MTYAAQYQYSLDQTFQQQIMQAIIIAAINISSESTGVTDHANRVVLLKSVMQNPASWVSPFAQAVVAAGSYTSTQADASIATQVSAVWNAIAGVT